ncbi:unnamed protein product [Paramecium sonneborni]|uniref:PPM-type phosphatase domain-containing protein n=1 Tax=Paramecium sonneborni TaxID=65129 RepID=A0A8S1K6C9_9CILI|nr:unnamed protein product [Paramecium sonneborni]
MYKNLTSLIQKPLTFLFNRTIKSLVVSDQKPKRKSKKQSGLSALDELLFRYTKPDQQFLDAKYGFNAQFIVYETKASYCDLSKSYSGEDNERFKNNYKSIVLPLIMIYGCHLYMNDETKCFFGSSSLKKNQLDQRVVLLQYAANNPIEDRYKVNQLKNINGYAVSVFDGHGGWQLAELAMNILHEKIDYYILKNQDQILNQDDLIQQSICQAYSDVEQEFYKVALQAYNMGFPSVARVGSCALTAIVVGNKVYSANLGDSKGIIVNVSNKMNEKAYKKINHTLNANSKKEQRRLKSVFSDDDIVVCKNGEKSCYVKGRLQPTRSLGDFRLKFQEFNNPKNVSEDKGYLKSISNFKGPYISSTPDQKVFEIQKGDRYLILGSDGLWDELSKSEISKIVQKNQNNKDEIIKQIFEESLSHAAKSNNMSDEDIRKIPLGKRRKLHDDITVIVVDLQGQI